MKRKRHITQRPFQRLTAVILILTLTVSMGTVPLALAQAGPVPKKGLSPLVPLVRLSPAYAPAQLKGIKLFADDPLRFDFIIDPGGSGLAGEELRGEAARLIKYFLAAVTVPEDDLWVNLSPHEKDRIIPDAFGRTGMGRDLLEQDYLLKQLTASLLYPEDNLGQEFWRRVYERAREEFGTMDIPVNTFHKIWIVADQARLYEHEDTVVIADWKLKVMMERDYAALQHNQNLEHGTWDIGEEYTKDVRREMFGEGRSEVSLRGATERSDAAILSSEERLLRSARNDTSSNPDNLNPTPLTLDPKKTLDPENDISESILRDIIIPEIEREVNQGKNFATLRQAYHALILATWYKRRLKDAFLNRIYADENKVKGIDITDPAMKERIYDRYISAFRRGVFNYIKEEYDPVTQKTLPRKYFSGGMQITPRDIQSSAVSSAFWRENVLPTLSAGTFLAMSAFAPLTAAPQEASALSLPGDAPDLETLKDSTFDSEFVLPSDALLAPHLQYLETLSRAGAADYLRDLDLAFRDDRLDRTTFQSFLNDVRENGMAWMRQEALRLLIAHDLIGLDRLAGLLDSRLAGKTVTDSELGAVVMGIAQNGSQAMLDFFDLWFPENWDRIRAVKISAYQLAVQIHEQNVSPAAADMILKKLEDWEQDRSLKQGIRQAREDRKDYAARMNAEDGFAQIIQESLQTGEHVLRRALLALDLDSLRGLRPQLNALALRGDVPPKVFQALVGFLAKTGRVSPQVEALAVDRFEDDHYAAGMAELMADVNTPWSRQSLRTQAYRPGATKEMLRAFGRIATPADLAFIEVALRAESQAAVAAGDAREDDPSGLSIDEEALRGLLESLEIRAGTRLLLAWLDHSRGGLHRPYYEDFAAGQLFRHYGFSAIAALDQEARTSGEALSREARAQQEKIDSKIRDLLAPLPESERSAFLKAHADDPEVLTAVILSGSYYVTAGAYQSLQASLNRLPGQPDIFTFLSGRYGPQLVQKFFLSAAVNGFSEELLSVRVLDQWLDRIDHGFDLMRLVLWAQSLEDVQAQQSVFAQLLAKWGNLDLSESFYTWHTMTSSGEKYYTSESLVYLFFLDDLAAGRMTLDQARAAADDPAKRLEKIRAVARQSDHPQRLNALAWIPRQSRVSLVASIKFNEDVDQLTQDLTSAVEVYFFLASQNIPRTARLRRSDLQGEGVTVLGEGRLIGPRERAWNILQKRIRKDYAHPDEFFNSPLFRDDRFREARIKFHLKMNSVRLQDPLLAMMSPEVRSEHTRIMAEDIWSNGEQEPVKKFYLSWARGELPDLDASWSDRFRERAAEHLARKGGWLSFRVTEFLKEERITAKEKAALYDLAINTFNLSRTKALHDIPNYPDTPRFKDLAATQVLNTFSRDPFGLWTVDEADQSKSERVTVLVDGFADLVADEIVAPDDPETLGMIREEMEGPETLLVSETLAQLEDPYSRTVAALRAAGADSKTVLFVEEIVEGQISQDEAMRQAGNPVELTRHMVGILGNGQHPLYNFAKEHVREEYLQRNRELNELHDETDAVGMASLQENTAQELYLLITFGAEEVVYDTTYRRLLTQFLSRLGAEGVSLDAFVNDLAQRQGYLRASLRTFWVTAIRYGRFRGLMDRLEPDTARSVLGWIVDGALKEEGEQEALEAAVLVVNMIGYLTPADQDIIAPVQTALRAAYQSVSPFGEEETGGLDRSLLQEVYRQVGPGDPRHVMYGLLAGKLADILPEDDPEAEWFRDMKQRYPMGNALETMTQEHLFNPDGSSVRVHGFHWDETTRDKRDAERTFGNLKSEYALDSRNWKRTDYDEDGFVVIESTSGNPVRIYANDPAAREAGKKNMLKAIMENEQGVQSFNFRVHSYYYNEIRWMLERLVDHYSGEGQSGILPRTIGLGQCGGDRRVQDVHTILGGRDLAVIRSTDSGDMQVNNPIDHRFANLVRRFDQDDPEAAISWSRFRQQQQRAYAREAPELYQTFLNYVFPDDDAVTSFLNAYQRLRAQADRIGPDLSSVEDGRGERAGDQGGGALGQDLANAGQRVALQRAGTAFDLLSSDQAMSVEEEQALFAELMAVVNGPYQGNLITYARTRDPDRGADAAARILSRGLASQELRQYLVSFLPQTERPGGPDTQSSPAVDNPGGIDFRPQRMNVIVAEQSRIISGFFATADVLADGQTLEGLAPVVFQLVPFSGLNTLAY